MEKSPHKYVAVSHKKTAKLAKLFISNFLFNIVPNLTFPQSQPIPPGGTTTQDIVCLSSSEILRAPVISVIPQLARERVSAHTRQRISGSKNQFLLLGPEYYKAQRSKRQVSWIDKCAVPK